ncbi:hypothetical protein LTR70_003055 [Exophiala xenobiotica]|uniref:Ribokinase n=1 Tax=Lithohypha guttulata TaxID=1690604 RepID=A0ABR0KHA6_9EURO|nr:hypothetical protein LTR24_002712 [Lithohypha guttulata]KAK5323766.1 hypothetical protein LTR70_003055 [Exophiala xenobiotica]
MTKPLIQVIGSLHLDFVTTTPRCPSAGETLQATRFDIGAGGKGANQAAACGRAAFVTSNEQDVQVEMSGVDTTNVREIPGTTTGSATIIVDEGAGGENRILFVPGAGFKGMDDAQEVLKRSGKTPDVVVLQGEIPRQTVLSIVEHYNASEQTQVVFNPAPVWPQGIPSKTLKGLGALIVNETECLLLTKSVASEGSKVTVVEKEEDLTEEILQQIGKEFHQLLSINTVIVTLGSKGVFYSQSNGSRGMIPAQQVEKVVDTTAAGDTFVGYFTAALARSIARGTKIEDFDVEAACKKANAASARCVARAGAMQSIPFGYE